MPGCGSAVLFCWSTYCAWCSDMMSRVRYSRLRVLGATLWRSLTLQGSWSFDGMQSLGFLFAMLPALRRYYQGPELAAACRRHLRHFNTHPVLATLILGASLRLEEHRSQGDEGLVDVVKFKEALVGPCAAMGDGFFWGGLRPLAAALGAGLGLTGSLWAIPVFLLVYNLPHLWLRVLGLLQGYRRGYRIVESLQHWHLPDWTQRLKRLTVVLLAVLCAWVSAAVAPAGRPTGAIWGLLGLPLVFLLVWLVRRGISPLLIGLAGCLLILSGVQICLMQGW